MPLTKQEITRIKKHLAANKALRACALCGAENEWTCRQVVFLPGWEHGRPQDGLGVKSVLIECDSCGGQCLLSAEKAGLA